MESQKIRDKFLRFFEKRGHKVMPSSLLIPEDETVLFTTAGMQQFKKYYLNPKDAPASKITTIQKCFRTSDIDEVGDKTHLTFFEMMGNFSFDDYFKKESISWAWEFLTGEEGLGINKKRISATYFEGDKGKGISKDKESLEILNKIEGLSKIEPQGFKDNFWSLGTEGSPGGPTVEFYVNGVEIWNLVFNEYIFENGKYNPSQFKGVDTGMGFERLVSVIEDKDNVYEIDLLEPIYKAIETSRNKKTDQKNLRILSDHIKASIFLANEEIFPSSKSDKGSVLRRLLRISITQAFLNLKEKNWYIKPIKKTVDIYEKIYPELKRNEEKIITIIQRENDEFWKKLVEFEHFALRREPDERDNQRIGVAWDQGYLFGNDAFYFYQTHGLRPEFMKALCKERGVEFDEEGFELAFKKAQKKHQEVSRKGAEKKFKGGLADKSYETIKLHTTAHLLLQALREVLGNHVLQKGSNITAERLRFDFSHPEKLTDEQIKKVEELVNKKIKENLPVNCEEMTVEEAKKQGAMGVFEERYGDKVKVYSVGSFSKEICGGPHIKNTRELGEFKIKKEESVGAGIRRIKAVLL